MDVKGVRFESAPLFLPQRGGACQDGFKEASRNFTLTFLHRLCYYSANTKGRKIVCVKMVEQRMSYA